MSEPKCCADCGRWGNQQFRWAAQIESWVCSNDRACLRRQQRDIYRRFYSREASLR